MKIENQDALKKWLVKVLNPIFEGDSEKLALYIVALAKKLENDQPSRQSCIDDLEVFLESNTNTFVESFFDAIFNKTYLQSDILETKHENEIKTSDETSKKFDQRRLSDTGSRMRSRLSRDYQEIDVSSRTTRAGSHGRRRKRSRNRTHGMSRSSSSSSSSPSPVRRSRSKSPFSRSRSRSPGQINEPKKQRCKDFDEKGFCTVAEMCPYDHGEVVVAPYVPPGQMSINVQSSQYNQYGQKRRIQMNKNGQQRYQKGNYNQRLGNVQGNDNMYTPSPIQPNQQPQQRQVVNTNRPRNLVSIVTSIHEDDTHDQSQQRGVKRTHNSNVKTGPSDNSYSSNVYDVNNEQFQQQQPNIPQNQQALLPTPTQYMGSGPHVQQPHFQQQQQQHPNAQNTTLILRKIPISLNTVDKMRQHFSKFGNIIDIQCHYDNLSDAALIKFTSNKEAFSAYKSPAPVFNNRFIRLYWLSSYLKQQQQQQPQQQEQQHQVQNVQQSPAIGEPSQKRPAKDRLSFPKSDGEGACQDGLNKENLAKTSTVNVTPSGSLSKTVYSNQNISSEISKTSDEIVKKYLPKETPESIALAKQIQEENKKKVLQLKSDLIKKARELMEQQLKDQKILMSKLEQVKTVDEKKQILDLMNKLNEAIDKEKEILNKKVDALEGDLTDTSKSPSIVSQSPFNFQKTHKPTFVIPPVHQLKINNKRLNTTSFLKAGANKLVNKPSVVAASVVQSVAAAPSPSLYTYSRVNVDNRPKQLLITGVENTQEKTNIVNFITSLGCQIESVNEDKQDSQMSLILNFVTRRDAEFAFNKCTASLTSKKITITWHKPVVEKKEEQKEEDKTEPEKTETKAENENNENGQTEEVNDSFTEFLSDDKTDETKDVSQNNGQNETTEENSNVFDSIFNE